MIAHFICEKFGFLCSGPEQTSAKFGPFTFDTGYWYIDVGAVFVAFLLVVVVFRKRQPLN